MASAYPPGADLRAQGASIERKVKTLINETLKQICRIEGLQVSGLKAQLQQRIISKVDQLVARGDADALNRIEYAVKNQGRPLNGGTPSSVTFVGSSPPAPSTSSRMSNGYAAAAHGSPLRGPNQPQSKITWKHTPFFHIESALTNTLDLPKLESHRQQLHMKLTIPEYLSERLRSDSKLRIMLYSAGEPLMGHGFMQHDVSFPPNMEVKINGTEDVKWNHKGLKNKPGSAQPGDLTPFLRKAPGHINDVGILYALTTKRFYMNIMLVKRSTPEELTKQLKTRPVISKNRVVREMLAKAADPDIEATSTNMSLKDPISMLRMTVPIRSAVCMHNQCFDAFTFLDMQQQGPTWTCPICSKPVEFDSLHIDEYVQDILEKAPRLDQVTLDPDGSWRPVVEKTDHRISNGGARNEYDDDSDDLVEISDYRPNGLKAEAPATPFSFGATPPQFSPAAVHGTRVSGSGGAGSKRKSEVIDLTLSDEDDEPVAKRPHLQPPASSSGFPGRLSNGYPPTSATPIAVPANGVQPFTFPSAPAAQRQGSASYGLPQPARQSSYGAQPSYRSDSSSSYDHRR